MKVIFIKNNFYNKYIFSCYEGFKFKPRRSIKSLIVYNQDMIKFILNKKVLRDINHSKKVINLMIKSDITILSDCDMMLDELRKIAFNLSNKYLNYFSELEYYELFKEIYNLNMLILSKKVIIESK